jgi:RimJ/RimL family protein N-acetyltransferase
MSRPAALTSKRALSKSVRLRGVRESDLETFFADQKDPEANRMAAFPARERDAFMIHWHRLMVDDSVIKRTIVFDGRVAGNVVCFMHGENREVGYWITRELWGKGIATLALWRFLRLVKDRPLYAGVAEHNVASIRVLEKCGFRKVRQEGSELTLELLSRA